MKKLFRVTAILLVGALLATPLAANAADNAYDRLAKGPIVGTAIPQPLKAPNQNGKPQDFASLKGARGLILLFSRSLGW